MNLYDTLEIKKGASISMIRAAYRRLARLYHPDKVQGMDNKFQEVKHAYEVLSDEDRRARYDRTGRDDDIQVTPARIQSMVEMTVLAIIMAERPDGTTDDPTWEDIRYKVVKSLKDNRREAQLNLKRANKQIDRLENLAKRFKSKTEADPVGDAFATHRRRMVTERNKLQDALELSHKTEEAFAAYDYVTGTVEPESEGQVNPGSTSRLSGTQFIPDYSGLG